VPELSILKPRDPAIKSEDDYEIYVLDNAQIFYTMGRQAGRHASLLDAFADTPLRVEGRLERIDRGKHKYRESPHHTFTLGGKKDSLIGYRLTVVKKPFRPVDIEICDVTKYSYGQNEDGEVTLWALGAAGWFEIRPARSYNEVFLDMCQAVKVFYFVTDIYSEQRKKGGPSAQLIYQEVSLPEKKTSRGCTLVNVTWNW
jgi:hypothetical protein